MPDFRERNLALQPWLTFDQVARRLAAAGARVHLITDTECEAEREGLEIHRVPSLRLNAGGRIEDIIRRLAPDTVVVQVSPFSLATALWYRVLRQFRSYAFVSYALYEPRELLRAAPHIGLSEIVGYARNLAAPRPLVRWRLGRNFEGVICQSERTARRLRALGGERLNVRTIPAGIDTSDWRPDANAGPKSGAEGAPYFLFVGSAKAIRGFDLLLDAVAGAPEARWTVKVLARGADADTVSRIQADVERRGLGHRVTVHAGWMDREALRREIASATAVVLPFVLVPAELPVSVLETMACGTPAIVSDIDGLPEAAGEAGLVVRQADAGGLAAAMARMADPEEAAARRAAAMRERDRIYDWQRVGEEWLALLAEGRRGGQADPPGGN